MKLLDIVKAQPILNNMKDKKLPIKVSFALARNIKNLEPAMANYDEAREKLMQEYGQKDDKGNLKVEEGKVRIVDVDKFKKEMDDLMEAECSDISVLSIPIEQLEVCETSDKYDALTVEEMTVLTNLGIIKEEE